MLELLNQLDDFDRKGDVKVKKNYENFLKIGPKSQKFHFFSDYKSRSGIGSSSA